MYHHDCCSDIAHSRTPLEVFPRDFPLPSPSNTPMKEWSGQCWAEANSILGVQIGPRRSKFFGGGVRAKPYLDRQGAK